MAGMRICKECGGGIMREDYEYVDGEAVRVWKCNNCFRWYVARTNKRKMAESGFTVRQEKTIERIYRKFIAREAYGNIENMEYKEWDVKGEDWSGQYVAIVNCKTGHKNDEGTMLAVIGRTSGQFFIHPSGKIIGAHIYAGRGKVEKKYIKQWTG